MPSIEDIWEKLVAIESKINENSTDLKSFKNELMYGNDPDKGTVFRSGYRISIRIQLYPHRDTASLRNNMLTLIGVHNGEQYFIIFDYVIPWSFNK